MREKLNKVICSILVAIFAISGILIPGTSGMAYASESGTHYGNCKVQIVPGSFSVPELNENGKCYILTLDGKRAFCLKRGMPAHSNVKYTSMKYGDNTTINKALNYFYDNDIPTEYDFYVMVQIYIWCALEGRNAEAAMNQAAASIGSDWYGRVGSIISGIEATTPREYYNVFLSENENEQPLAMMVGVNMEIPQYTEVAANAEAKGALESVINVTKVDSDTGEALEGAQIEFFVDGKSIGRKTTDAKGFASMSYKEDIKATGSSKAEYNSNFGDLSYYYRGRVTGFKDKSAAYNSAMSKAQAAAGANLAALLKSTSHVYSAVEVSPRKGYYVPESGVGASRKASGSANISLVLENKSAFGEIVIRKSEAGEGEISLKGAEYTVVAAEDILHPDGKTGVVLAAGESAGEAVTDEKGEAKITGLYPGKYLVRETKAPYGYVRDEKDHPLEISWENPGLQLIRNEIELVNTPAVGSINLTKTGDVVKGYDESDEPVYEKGFLEGAVFSVSTAENIYSADDSHRLLAEAGCVMGRITTGKEGKGSLGNLPLGKYIVKETKAPKGYILGDKEYEVTLSYKDDESAVAVELTVDNEPEKPEVLEFVEVNPDVPEEAPAPEEAPITQTAPVTGDDMADFLKYLAMIMSVCGLALAWTFRLNRW